MLSVGALLPRSRRIGVGADVYVGIGFLAVLVLLLALLIWPHDETHGPDR
jgi:hypothetical protein